MNDRCSPVWIRPLPCGCVPGFNECMTAKILWSDVVFVYKRVLENRLTLEDLARSKRLYMDHFRGRTNSDPLVHAESVAQGDVG